VRVAFYSILLAREVVTIRTEALDLLTRHLETTRLKYDVGVVSRFDVLRSEVEVANARPPLISARKDLVLAGETLKRVMGVDVSEPFEIDGELTCRGGGSTGVEGGHEAGADNRPQASGSRQRT
jgi:outer membrane protein TolC